MQSAMNTAISTAVEADVSRVLGKDASLLSLDLLSGGHSCVTHHLSGGCESAPGQMQAAQGS